MNTLDLTGPVFLAIYFVLIPLTIAASVLCRRKLREADEGSDFEDEALDDYEAAFRMFRKPAKGKTSGDDDLDGFEAAYLAGGGARAADAAIAGMVQDGRLTVERSRRSIRASKPLPGTLHPLERAVATDWRGDPVASRTIAGTRKAARPELEAIRDRLRSLGLIESAGRSWTIRLVSTAPMIVLLAFGAAKIHIGLVRDRPVGLLLLLCAIVAVAGIVAFCLPIHRTPKGDRALERLQSSHAALGVTGTTRASALEGSELAMALGLFGTGVLAGDLLDDLKYAFTPPGASWSGGFGGGDSCGGGDGGGGGGCGGGCGGCGD